MLKQFKGYLTMPDHILKDIGLSREAVVRDRLRYRFTGAVPYYFW
ncbi:MAG: hypothetical protein AAF748_14595 [Pseudomonadota bacterium]